MKHWSNNKKLEMSQEKLQLIAAASATSTHKVKWLGFWNSSFHSRQAVHFPAKGFTDRDLESWLNKATFWAGVSKQRPFALLMFILIKILLGHDI
jgi:hypothetical protein